MLMNAIGNGKFKGIALDSEVYAKSFAQLAKHKRSIP